LAVIDVFKIGLTKLQETCNKTSGDFKANIKFISQNFKELFVAIVAMPPYYFSTKGSTKYFDSLKGRAGSHFAPAKLTSASARISEIKNPDYLCITHLLQLQRIFCLAPSNIFLYRS
jgi:hypothetical protein